MKQTMTPWNDLSYQRITDAKFTNNSVMVSFENGDMVKVEKDFITPFGFSQIEWNNVSFNPFEISIPAKPSSIEVPWDKIRVITDKEFARSLADRAEEQAKLIGLKIKRLREKKNIKSFELAERAGLTAQTISRIEQGHTDVNFGTLRKILAAMGYNLKDLANQETEIEMENSPKSYGFLIKKLNQAGLDTRLVTRKIIPQKLQNLLESRKADLPPMLLDEAVSYISNVYGWAPNDIWGNRTLILKDNPAQYAFFKKPSNSNDSQIKAYCHYAYYLAKIILRGSVPKSTDSYPESLEDFKAMYLKRYSKIDLKSLLEFVWGLGIAVLPLNDSGLFHGASWNIDGRHVVVLKQNSKSHARWIFDLLHELYHVFVHLQKDNTSVIEVEELSPFSNNESIEELEANSFANQAIFGNKAEKLAEQCVEIANWKLENLKNAVIKVSKKEKISEDFLSNYLAFRLAYQGQDWWATATKMQVSDPLPFNIAAEILRKNVQVKNLNPIDYNLLEAAIAV